MSYPTVTRKPNYTSVRYKYLILSGHFQHCKNIELERGLKELDRKMERELKEIKKLKMKKPKI